MTTPSLLPAIVLAGGLGTRLREITKDRWPKPMTPVQGHGGTRPFLEWPLSWLQREGIRDVIICLGHLGDQVREYFGDGRTLGLNIIYDDAGGADTGARCRAAFERLSTDLALVVCGDVLVDFPIAPFLAEMTRRPELLAKLALARRAPGTVPNTVVDAAGLVTAFSDKGVQGSQKGIEAGVLILQRAALDGFDADADLSLTKHVYPRLIAKQALGAAIVAEDFHDIGTPEGYARFCDFAKTGWNPLSLSGSMRTAKSSA